MFKLFAFSAAALLAAAGAPAQPAPEALTFEVASIKPAAPLQPVVVTAGGAARSAIRTGLQGGPGTPNPGRMTFSYSTVKQLLTTAYGLRPYQVEGPAWIDSDRFDIVAKVPEGATKEQSRIMLQNLLKERFKLELKQEQRELPIYALTVAKGGPKLKPAADDPPAEQSKPGEPSAPLSFDAIRSIMTSGGIPSFPPGMRSGNSMSMVTNGRMIMIMRAIAIAALADAVSFQVSRPVKDETGLDGKYDVILTFEPENRSMGMSGPVVRGMATAAAGAPDAPSAGVPEAQEPVPSLGAALQQQLGLKLEQKKGMVDMLVVLRGEKTPIEN